ncbi:MAG: hypothetical protein KGL12_07180 [Rhodospirillales bacterium]|nr:hypothetical protein [Rhodospirillales bacterium]
MRKQLLCGMALVALLVPSAARAAGSGITAITIAGQQPLGSFNGVAYARVWGDVAGVVAPGEKVEGLAALPKNAAGDYPYRSAFEIIAPVRHGQSATVLVEVENRGNPLMPGDLDHFHVAGVPAKAAYPQGLGNGFLQDAGIAYARVAWQTGISPGVPKSAQGVGEVILRDFARLLGGDRENLAKGAADFGTYRFRMLGGISQSAWFVNTFIAEGFNADPTSGKPVFQGAIAIDGTGNWLALNRLAAAAHATQAPYFAPNARPLSAAQLLHRPASDPFYIDVANYTDFYRVHASLTDTAALPATMRRYDWPSPHHPVTTAADARATFAPGRPGGPCNDGVAVPVNPTSYNPFLRTLVVELAHQLGAPEAAQAPSLPPSTLFRLGPAPASTAHFNPLPGAALEVPLTGAEAQPLGGVRFPEVVAPLGRPSPVSLPPVITSAITGVCGNIGEWQPLTKAALIHRYAGAAGFLNDYAQAIDRLVAGGYLLAGQKQPMLIQAGAQYAAAMGGK